MNQQLGYTQPLYILAFDQRGSFMKKVFNAESVTDEQLQQAKGLKQLIYSAFKQAIAQEIPKNNAAILVDEYFGTEILQDAVNNGYHVLLTTEKSGQEEFDFEHGEDFGKFIDAIHPTFAKALVRYNPEEDSALNSRQRTKLKQLADYCHNGGYKFLVEPIVFPLDQQLEQVAGDHKRFDEEIRPGLTVTMMQQFQNEGIEVDVWKIEGFETRTDYEQVSAQARSGGRDQVGVIVLGRGATDDQVNRWLEAGKGVPGIIGFAIGRTIFLDSVVAAYEGKISSEEAIKDMTEKYLEFYHTFIQ